MPADTSTSILFSVPHSSGYPLLYFFSLFLLFSLHLHLLLPEVSIQYQGTKQDKQEHHYTDRGSVTSLLRFKVPVIDLPGQR